jgi:hypothetical protein
MKNDSVLKLHHYKFTKKDAIILKKLRHLAENHVEEFVE